MNQPPAQPPARGGHPSGAAPEQIIFEGSARHSVVLGNYLVWGLVTIGLGAGGWALGQLPQVAAATELPLYLLAAAGIPGIGWTYLVHSTKRYKITTRRVEFERGVVAKDVDSFELWRVLDVRFKQSIMDRILGNAKIILIGTDQTHAELELHGLPEPRKLFERIRDAVEVARRTSRPMELVGQEGGAGFGAGGGPADFVG